MQQSKLRVVRLPFCMALFLVLLGVMRVSAQGSYVSDLAKMGLKGSVRSVKMYKFVPNSIDSTCVDSFFVSEMLFTYRGDVESEYRENGTTILQSSTTDNNGHIIERRTFHDENRFSQTIFEYEQGGAHRLVKGTIITYPRKDGRGEIKETITYEYDPDFSITYSRNGKMVRKEEYSDGMLIQEKTFEGDSVNILYGYSEGRIAQKDVYDANYNPISTIKYEYKPTGVTIIEEKNEGSIKTVFKEEYDGMGNWVRRTDTDRHILYKRIITYYETPSTTAY